MKFGVAVNFQTINKINDNNYEDKHMFMDDEYPIAVDDDEEFEDVDFTAESITCTECDETFIVMNGDTNDEFTIEDKLAIGFCPYCGSQV